MDNRKVKLIVVAGLLLLLGLSLLLYRSTVMPDPVDNMNQAPLNSFYTYKDGMPCLNFVWEHTLNTTDIDISTTCDWSQWKLSPTQKP